MANTSEEKKGASVKVIVAIACITIAAIVTLITMRPSAPKVVSGQWYYELNTSKLFVYHGQDRFPPITTENGQQAVQAFVLSCGDCADAKSRFVGYLKMYPEAAKKELEGPKKKPGAAGRESTRDVAGGAGSTTTDVVTAAMVTNPKDTKIWHSIQSSEGIAIVNEATNSCGGGKTASECPPFE